MYSQIGGLKDQTFNTSGNEYSFRSDSFPVSPSSLKKKQIIRETEESLESSQNALQTQAHSKQQFQGNRLDANLSPSRFKRKYIIYKYHHNGRLHLRKNSFSKEGTQDLDTSSPLQNRSPSLAIEGRHSHATTRERERERDIALIPTSQTPYETHYSTSEQITNPSPPLAFPGSSPIITHEHIQRARANRPKSSLAIYQRNIQNIKKNFTIRDGEIFYNPKLIPEQFIVATSNVEGLNIHSPLHDSRGMAEALRTSETGHGVLPTFGNSENVSPPHQHMKPHYNMSPTEREREIETDANFKQSKPGSATTGWSEQQKKGKSSRAVNVGSGYDKRPITKGSSSISGARPDTYGYLPLSSQDNTKRKWGRGQSYTSYAGKERIYQDFSINTFASSNLPQLPIYQNKYTSQKAEKKMPKIHANNVNLMATGKTIRNQEIQELQEGGEKGKETTIRISSPNRKAARNKRCERCVTKEREFLERATEKPKLMSADFHYDYIDENSYHLNSKTGNNSTCKDRKNVSHYSSTQNPDLLYSPIVQESLSSPTQRTNTHNELHQNPNHISQLHQTSHLSDYSQLSPLDHLHNYNQKSNANSPTRYQNTLFPDRSPLNPQGKTNSAGVNTVTVNTHYHNQLSSPPCKEGFSAAAFQTSHDNINTFENENTNPNANITQIQEFDELKEDLESLKSLDLDDAALSKFTYRAYLKYRHRDIFKNKNARPGAYSQKRRYSNKFNKSIGFGIGKHGKNSDVNVSTTQAHYPRTASECKDNSRVKTRQGNNAINEIVNLKELDVLKRKTDTMSGGENLKDEWFNSNKLKQLLKCKQKLLVENIHSVSPSEIVEEFNREKLQDKLDEKNRRFKRLQLQWINNLGVQKYQEFYKQITANSIDKQDLERIKIGRSCGKLKKNRVCLPEFKIGLKQSVRQLHANIVDVNTENIEETTQQTQQEENNEINQPEIDHDANKPILQQNPFQQDHQQPRKQIIESIQIIPENHDPSSNIIFASEFILPPFDYSKLSEYCSHPFRKIWKYYACHSQAKGCSFTIYT
jgi:hypothetical protein